MRVAIEAGKGFLRGKPLSSSEQELAKPQTLPPRFKVMADLFYGDAATEIFDAKATGGPKILCCGPTLTVPAENGSHPPESRYLRLASRSGSGRGPLPSGREQCAEDTQKAGSQPALAHCTARQRRWEPVRQLNPKPRENKKVSDDRPSVLFLRGKNPLIGGAVYWPPYSTRAGAVHGDRTG
ncbi:hypothetical protein CCHR01_06526 [Colletotrichum chrysophilum]|uniref:Uncharacterized protein n=1 Tax=Colletotrichum chrysophilum TaxID=1836956 RepID=A0AAD9ALX2_9PEZI|nr:hypothetical protein CCHR01_06526 [Colletotrichum chrysophilum]